MRIIGGISRGKRIDVVKRLPRRPTTDFAKEALFDVANNKIDLDGAEVELRAQAILHSNVPHGEPM